MAKELETWTTESIDGEHGLMELRELEKTVKGTQ